MKRNNIQEMGAVASFWAPESKEMVEIPATLWGTADDIEVQPRVLSEGSEPELCVTFVAEGGYAGGRIRVADLLRVVAQHHPRLMQEALLKPASTDEGATHEDETGQH